MQSIRTRTVTHRALGALLASAIALTSTQVAAAAETQDKAQLQKQLDDARGRLDDAARDVADISRQLYGDDMQGAPMPPPGGKPRGAMLGINIGGSPDLAEGVEVMGVSPSGPAAAAGLDEGDVILSIAGRTPENPRHAFRILGSYQPNEKVKFEVLRQRKRLTLDVQMPDVDPMNPGVRPGPPPRAPNAPAPPVPPADTKSQGIAS
jgi:predicted metalloprotease with PDZ domain